MQGSQEVDGAVEWGRGRRPELRVAGPEAAGRSEAPGMAGVLGRGHILSQELCHPLAGQGAARGEEGRPVATGRLRGWDVCPGGQEPEEQRLGKRQEAPGLPHHLLQITCTREPPRPPLS